MNPTKPLKQIVIKILQVAKQSESVFQISQNFIQSINTKLYKVKFNKISSTMLLSQQWPKDQVLNNQLYMFKSDSQTNGVGQRQNKWSSPKGNLYMTLLFKTNFQQLPILSMATVLAVSNILQKLIMIDQQKQFTQNKKVKIKWINDIMVNNKKISGILIRNSLIGPNVYAQVGIGININFAPLQTSTCLKQVINEQKSGNLIDLISENLAQELMKILKKDKKQIISQYGKKLMYFNQKVLIFDQALKNVLFSGDFIGIDENGFAKLKEIQQPISKGRMRKYQENIQQVFTKFVKQNNQNKVKMIE